MEMLPIYISPGRVISRGSPAAPAGPGGRWLLKGGYNSEWVLPKRGI